MNNATIINIFNVDSRSIAYIKTQHFQMATIAYRILKFESMIKKNNSSKPYILYFYYF